MSLKRRIARNIVRASGKTVERMRFRVGGRGRIYTETWRQAAVRTLYVPPELIYFDESHPRGPLKARGYKRIAFEEARPQ